MRIADHRRRGGLEDLPHTPTRYTNEATMDSNSSTPAQNPGNGTMKEPPPAAQPQLLERVTEGAHQTVDRLAEALAPQAQYLEETVAGANEALHERADEVRALSDQWLGQLRSAVREHPLTAMATALSAGLLIASLLRSER